MMRTNRWLLAAAAFCAASGAGCDKLKSLAGGAAGSLFGADFEGEITMAATAKGQPAPVGPTSLVIDVKKPKFRIDATGNTGSNNPMLAQSASLILDPPNKKAYALLPSQKKAFVLDMDKMKNMPGAGGPHGRASGGGASGGGSAGTIEKTGKTDVVAGYKCEIWKVTPADPSGHKGEICAAEGITWIDLGDLGWSSPEISVAAVMKGMNHFPIRIVSYDAQGNEQTRLEATKIDKKKLDDARFTVPPDYQVVDIAAMLQGFHGLPDLGLPKP